MTAKDLISPSFLQRLMQDRYPGETIGVESVKPLELDNSSSILTVLTAGQSGQLMGHFGLEISYSRNGQIHRRNMALKVKPHAREILGMIQGLSNFCGEPLASAFGQYGHRSGFQFTHERELEIYGTYRPGNGPEIFGVRAMEDEGIYLILMEHLGQANLLHSVMEPEAWSGTPTRIQLDGMAQWHARFLQEGGQPLPKWPDQPSLAYMLEMKPFWEALAENAFRHHPGMLPPERQALWLSCIDSLATDWGLLDSLPKTVIHNDFNPRNACIRHGKLACAYDWELACVHVPQYDVAEFLAFTLTGPSADAVPWVNHFRRTLHALTGKFADEALFWEGFRAATRHFLIHRLGMYLIAHTASPYPYLDRVMNQTFALLEGSRVPSRG